MQTRPFFRTALLSCAASVLLIGCSPRNPIPEYVPPRPAQAENGWPSILEQHDDYVGTGTDIGDFMLPFKVHDEDGDIVTGGLGDQNNNLVDFRQLLGHAILLDLSSVWCGPCNEAAGESAELLEEMLHIGPSLIVTVLVQGEGGLPATVDEAAEWAEQYHAEYPVLIDTPEETTRDAWGGAGFPTFWMIGPNGEIFDTFTSVPSESDVLDGVRFAVEEWGSDFRQIDEPTDDGAR